MMMDITTNVMEHRHSSVYVENLLFVGIVGPSRDLHFALFYWASFAMGHFIAGSPIA